MAEPSRRYRLFRSGGCAPSADLRIDCIAEMSDVAIQCSKFLRALRRSGQKCIAEATGPHLECPSIVRQSDQDMPLVCDIAGSVHHPAVSRRFKSGVSALDSNAR